MGALYYDHKGIAFVCRNCYLLFVVVMLMLVVVMLLFVVEVVAVGVGVEALLVVIGVLLGMN